MRDIKHVFLAMAITVLVVYILSTAAKAETLSHQEVIKICRQYSYADCDLVSAIAWTESHYKPESYNNEKNGSYGIMQVQCSTAKMTGLKYSCEQLFDKRIGIRFGIKYLQLIGDRLQTDNVKSILAAWNAGMRWSRENGYQNITCRDYNRFTWGGLSSVECFPGEYINQEYVWKTYRRYQYLRGKYESRIIGI